MGIVYQGFDPVIGRTVAIKTMLPEGLSPQEFQEYKARFQREAMAAGILAHPNIITVYDFGEDNGVLYLAMEFLEGKSLEKIVQEQTVLPIETILPIYDQVCGALDHAHRNKIVHRDVKPANIMILHNGLVKVTDFGIAKMMAMGMTQAGQILGTPNYMSPEQVKGRQIDGRSDIFSLGVILYELVTGEKPFGGQNITTVIYKIINENPIPPRELDASIPAGLSYVISKALAKNVEERYQTCRELAEDLRNYRNLGGGVIAQSTVILKAAPVPMAAPEPPVPAQTLPFRTQMPQSAPPSVDEAPIASPISIQMMPPTPQRQQSIPQIAYVLGALLLVAIMGAVAYFVVIKPPRPVGGSSNVAVTSPVPVAQPPAVQTGTTVQTTPELPKANESVTPKPEEVPVKPEVTTKPEPHAGGHTAASKAGQLMVNANVSGAKISVDGQSDPTWLTPHTIPDLPAGAHNIVVSMDGYEDFHQSVTVAAGQTTSVMGNLSSPRAELDMNTNPPGAEILIDGKSYGPSPVHATLTPGTHSYTVKSPGSAPFENTVTLKSGDIITKTLTFSANAKTGIALVRTIPPGATVQADGAQVGGQTPTSFRLSVGSHMLVVSLSGYRPVQQQVTVSENETREINITLNSN